MPLDYPVLYGADLHGGISGFIPGFGVEDILINFAQLEVLPKKMVVTIPIFIPASLLMMAHLYLVLPGIMTVMEILFLKKKTSEALEQVLSLMPELLHGILVKQKLSMQIISN